MTEGTGSEIVVVDTLWERFAEVRALSYDVLYREFGVDAEAEWFHLADGGEFAVALGSAGSVLGSARLLPQAGDSQRQLRQVAVVPQSQGTGLGRALVAVLEWRAADEGAQEIWLNARQSVIAFYERLGYVCEGEPFTSKLTGIPHRRMRKRLR